MKQKIADQIIKDWDDFIEPNPSSPMTDHWKLKSVLSKYIEKEVSKGATGGEDFTRIMGGLSGTRK